MGYQIAQSVAREVWALARGQYFVVSRGQLLALGMHPQAVKHRVSTGRLHGVHRGVYAVGRRDLSRNGELMAAVLACGQGAVLSHRSAAELWGLGAGGSVEVTVPPGRSPKRPGIRVHRRELDRAHVIPWYEIPVTTPVRTLVDMASHLPRDHLERAVNEADRLDLIDPEALREALDGFVWQPGVGKLRTLLDRRTFTFTDSALERQAHSPGCRAAQAAHPNNGSMAFASTSSGRSLDWW